MPITGPGSYIPITKDTTVDQIKTFTDGLDKDARLKAKVDKTTGETVLYAGPKSSNIFRILSGKSAERRDLARTEIETVFGRAIDGMQNATDKEFSRADRNALKRLNTNIHARFNDVEGHSLKGGLVSELASSVKGAQAYGKAPAPEPGPTLASLGDFSMELSTGAEYLNEVIKSGDDIERAGRLFGDMMAKHVDLLDPGDDERLLFATSQGSVLKEELLKAMAQSLGDPDGPALLKSKEAKAFLDAAYKSAASQVLPGNSEVPNTKTTIDWKDEKGNAKSRDVPDIMVDGVRYRPVKHLGSGGFADVFSFKAADGSGKMIAYKMGLSSKPDALADLGKEIRNHKALAGDGHPNVIGFKGAIRSPDGRLGIAMEYAPGGVTLLDFATKLKGMIGIGRGQVSPEVAEIVRLSLLHDTGDGVGHIQNTTGGMHGDLKSPNVVIGADGRAKIVDFGLAREGSSARLVDYDRPDNPLWLAPEVLLGTTKIENLSMLESDPALEGEAQAIIARVKHFLPDISDKDALTLAISTLQPDIQAEQAEVVIDSRADTYALGVIARDLWTGELMLEDENTGFNSVLEERISDYGSNPFNEAVGRRGPDGRLQSSALTGSTGNHGVDGLINELMAPLKDDRPELTDVSDHFVFDRPGVNSPEVQELIKAIVKGDAGEITRCARALEVVAGL